MPDPASQRRTKIVCTLGPSTDAPGVLRAMLTAGMNVARLNFSHGAHEEHRERCDQVRAVAEELGLTVGVMVDLQGPKIRTGLLENHEPVLLVDGAPFCLTTRDVVGNVELASVSYPHFAEDVEDGESIFIADGLLELRVERVEGPDVHCTVIHGGALGERKGINLPGTNVSAPALGPKDKEDLQFAIKLDADFVALSFVRSADDVDELRKIITDAHAPIAIVSKIERPEALKDISAIIRASDVIMLARGDLGVEVPLDELPQIQKGLIRECNDLGVPIITATQMLESMTSHPRPTRAEVADVANAIYDGTDAVMLSGETASGDHPVMAVQTMANISFNADKALSDTPPHDRIIRMRESGIRTGRGNFGDAICQSACRIANAIGARRIVCFTKTGAGAALIARYRPQVPITALALDDAVRRRCAVIWGVDSARTVELCTTDEMPALIDDILVKKGLADPDDIVVVVGGIPLAVRTRTNMLKIHRVAQPGIHEADENPSGQSP